MPGKEFGLRAKTDVKFCSGTDVGAVHLVISYPSVVTKLAAADFLLLCIRNRMKSFLQTRFMLNLKSLVRETERDVQERFELSLLNGQEK